jgi:hypothetical protein
VYRIGAIILVGAFLLLGSGAAAYVHNALHAMQDATHEATAHHDHEHGDHHAPAAPSKPHHNANNCAVHAQLASPLVGGAGVTLLVLFGLFVAFLTLLSPQPISYRPPLQLSCRGPPASPAHPV